MLCAPGARCIGLGIPVRVFTPATGKFFIVAALNMLIDSISRPTDCNTALGGGQVSFKIDSKIFLCHFMVCAKNETYIIIMAPVVLKMVLW